MPQFCWYCLKFFVPAIFFKIGVFFGGGQESVIPPCLSSLSGVGSYIIWEGSLVADLSRDRSPGGARKGREEDIFEVTRWPPLPSPMQGPPLMLRPLLFFCFPFLSLCPGGVAGPPPPFSVSNRGQPGLYASRAHFRTCAAAHISFVAPFAALALMPLLQHHT